MVAESVQSVAKAEATATTTGAMARVQATIVEVAKWLGTEARGEGAARQATCRGSDFGGDAG